MPVRENVAVDSFFSISRGDGNFVLVLYSNKIQKGHFQLKYQEKAKSRERGGENLLGGKFPLAPLHPPPIGAIVWNAVNMFQILLVKYTFLTLVKYRLLYLDLFKAHHLLDIWVCYLLWKIYLSSFFSRKKDYKIIGKCCLCSFCFSLKQ